MENVDTRVQYTKSALKKALLQLLEQKAISKVSIKELCETAKLNRGTFYLHYTSPEDILDEIEQDFLKENRELFENYFSEDRDRNLMDKIFDYISQNRDICEVLMGSNANLHFTDKIKEMFHDRIIEGWHTDFPQYSLVDLEFLYEFVFTGSVHLILEWIHDDQGISAAEFNNRLDRLGYHALLAIADF